MIKNVAGFDQFLKSNSAQSWVKKADLDVKTPLSLEDAPSLGVEKSSSKSFGEFLSESISKVNEMQAEADVATQKLASGESKNIHETLLAVEQAEMAFKMMNQIRLKVIDAYKEVMKMQI